MFILSDEEHEAWRIEVEKWVEKGKQKDIKKKEKEEDGL